MSSNRIINEKTPVEQPGNGFKELRLIPWSNLLSLLDLNPFLNFWKNIKEDVFKDKPLNNQELWTVVEQVWWSIAPQRSHRLYDFMQGRCEGVFKNNV